MGVTRPGAKLRGQQGHGVRIGTGAQPVDPNGRTQVGGGPEPEAPLLEGQGAVALGLPKVAKGGQGPLGQTADLELEVPTGGDGDLEQEVLSGVQVLRGGPGVPGDEVAITQALLQETINSLKVQSHRGPEEVSERGWVKDHQVGLMILIFSEDVYVTGSSCRTDCADTTDTAVNQTARLNKKSKK